MYITDPKELARRYTRGWFGLDFISVAVSAIDVYSVGRDTGSLSRLKIILVLRVLRLIKLARLLRASRILKRWEARMSINYSLLSLCSAVFTVVLTAHWVGCAWALQAHLQTDLMNTWLSGTYCNPQLDNGTVVPEEFVCVSAFDQYMAAVYWATMTITSIGYGDIAATPGNSTEQAWGTLLMLVSSLTWGQVIGTFVGVIATFNP